MEGYLKVTPEQLMKAADSFAQAGASIGSLTSEMMSIVNSLKGIWQGEAAESYTGKFTGLEDDISRINNMITEHVNDLNEMARTYQAAEDASAQESAALLSDVVNLARNQWPANQANQIHRRMKHGSWLQNADPG